jgi:RNA polymerase sigma-70 factor, ECF subfamily
MYDFTALADEELMEAFYASDPAPAAEAFTELDRRYRPQLTHSLTLAGYNARFLKLPRMAGRHETAEELAAETLLKAAETKNRPSARWQRSRKRVHPWLFGILHNVVISFLRRKRLAVVVAADRSLERIPDATPRPAEALSHGALHEALRECLAELPADLRVVCDLVFDRGMKQTEVAALLNVSAPTLTRRKQEAFDRLRFGLRQKGIVGGQPA